MPKIFISYRRDDSEFAVDPIYKRLSSHFGSESVFMDVDTIPKGVDFRTQLNDAVRQCDVLLAVIGKHWLDSRKNDGTRRLDDPADFVRIEIQAALERNIPVIPVLLGGVSMPRNEELPAELGDLVYRNAAELRRGSDFERHLDGLVQDLEFLAHQHADMTRKPAVVPRNESEPSLARFVCPACNARFKLPKKMAGDSLHCPKCGQLSRVGDSQDAEPPAESSNVRVISNSIGMQLALIPAGEFLMGSPKTERDRSRHEGPQHLVQINKAFYMGVCEVTQDEYEPIMGTNPSDFKGDGRLPVEMVSWEDAVDFCRKLSTIPAEHQADRAYRLPTEAEWEYACRAGTTTPFHFGNSLSSRQANFGGTHPYGDGESGPFLKRPTEVGWYAQNAFGLYDMHGNLFEWCADWFSKDYYAGSPTVDPQGPSDGSSRVLRGGCWFNPGRNCRAASRHSNPPANRSRVHGFRVVCPS